jgi:hypothetical protein
MFRSDKGYYLRPDAIPASADAILTKALDEQDRIWQQAADQAASRQEEEHTRTSRAHLATFQQRRRVRRMEAVEEAAVSTLQLGVEAVRQAMRDTPSTLRPDGHQLYQFPNRDIYDGEWRNTNLHGRGRWFAHEAQQEYDGEWFLGVRSGNGTFRCRGTNTAYVGRWYEGRRHGKGEMTEPEGAYKGEFRDHRFHGFGEYGYTDGHRYRGEWADDRYDGNGVYTMPSGARYEGEWSHGLQHGKCTAFFDGQGKETYVGEWRDGKRHGRGTHRTTDFVYVGEWAFDSWSGAGVCTWASGDAYDGEFARNAQHGQGTLRCANGAIYSGEWKYGKREGRGVYHAPNKRATYEGEWAEDLKHGRGVLTMHLAGSVTGTWIKDQLHGKAVFKPAHGEPAAVLYDHGRCVECQPKEIYVKIALSLGRPEDEEDIRRSTASTSAEPQRAARASPLGPR